MKLRIKFGAELLFLVHDGDTYIANYDDGDELYFWFNNKTEFFGFKQIRNRLILRTGDGDAHLVFVSEVPKLEFSHYEKDQLCLKIIHSK
jgi:hypothetical protein